MTDQLLQVSDDASSFTAKASGAIDAGAFVCATKDADDVVSAAVSSLNQALPPSKCLLSRNQVRTMGFETNNRIMGKIAAY